MLIQTKQQALADWLMLNYTINTTSIDWTGCESTTNYAILLTYVCKLYNVKTGNTLMTKSQLEFEWNENLLKDIDIKIHSTTTHTGYPGTTIKLCRKRKRSDAEELCKEFDWVMALDVDKKSVNKLFKDKKPSESEDPEVKEEWRFKYKDTLFSVYQLESQDREWDLAVESSAMSKTSVIQELIDKLELYFDTHCII